MGNLKFECPECEGTTLEEITTGVTVRSRITDLQRDGFAEYSEQDNEDGATERYQCARCGYVIKDEVGWEIPSAEEMYQVAVKKGWIKNA